MLESLDRDAFSSSNALRFADVTIASPLSDEAVSRPNAPSQVLHIY
jgi:hypothetical protein